MKNILIVICKITYNWSAWPVPAVGSGYVMASLKNMLKSSKSKTKVYCCNLNLEQGTVEEVLKKSIYDNNIDIIMCGDLVVNYNQVKKIIEASKILKPEIVSIIGGSLVSNSPKIAMEGIKKADFGIIGEGEITACELINYLICENTTSCKGIKGIIYREREGLVITSKREDIENLDSLPWVDYEGIGYFQMIDKFNNENDMISVGLTTSRSCPYNCTFCSKSGGEKYRQRNLDNIFEELDYLVTNHQVKRIFLNDELFTNNSARLIEFCNRIKPYKLVWIVFLRISENITKDILIKMKDSGCEQIFYGIESGDNKVLKSMKKGITVEQIENVICKTKNAGIIVSGGFIFGDKEESIETVCNSLEFLNKNIMYFENISVDPIVLYPGSKLYIDAVKSGKIPDELNFIENECPLTNVSQLSGAQYLDLVNKTLPGESAKIFFYRHKIWLNKIKFTSMEDKYLLTVKCPNCSNANYYDMFPKEIPFDFSLECDSCLKTLNVNALNQYLDYIGTDWEILTKDKRIGIMGSGRLFSIVCSKLNFFKNKANFFFIIFDKRKQEWGFGTNQKYSIQEISKLNLDIIIYFKTNKGQDLEEIENKRSISFFEIGLHKNS